MGLALLLRRVDEPVVGLPRARPILADGPPGLPALLQPTPAEAVLAVAFRARLLLMGQSQVDLFALRLDPPAPPRPWSARPPAAGDDEAVAPIGVPEEA